MKILRIPAVLVSLMLLSACAILECQPEGRLAALRREGATLAFTDRDIAVIESVLKDHGAVRIVSLEVFTPDEIRITSEFYRSGPPTFYDDFEKRKGS